jgi:hypothetical protein
MKLSKLYESYVIALELCRCIVRDGGLMPDRSFMTLEMGAQCPTGPL